jgi:hypothetical protein
MPFFTSPEDSLSHLIAKGLPSQMPYVRHSPLSSTARCTSLPS